MMNGKKKGLKLIAFLLAAMTLLSACGSSSKGSAAASQSAAYPVPAPAAAYMPEEPMEYAAADEAYYEEVGLYAEAEEALEMDYKASGGTQTAVIREETPVSSDRKLIRTINLEAEAYNLNEVDRFISAKVAELGGYIESENKYSGSRRGYGVYSEEGTEEKEEDRWTSASYVLRIPSSRLDGFVAAVDRQANIVSQSSNVEDITLRYVDMESKKTALQTEQKRLMELMEKAETVEDMIRIEERLTDVRYQLESTESQLRSMANQVNYSTVYLSVQRVNRYTVVQEPRSVGERIVQGFHESVEDVADSLQELGIWLVVNSPYLVFVAIFILVLLFFGWLARRIFRKGTGRARKNEEEDAAAADNGENGQVTRRRKGLFRRSKKG